MITKITKSPLKGSVWDRLLSEDEGGGSGGAGFSSNDIIGFCRRDIEDLLNSKRTWFFWDDSLMQLEYSVLGYGGPDISLVDLATIEAKNDFVREVGAVLRKQDPRFVELSSNVVLDTESVSRVLGFHLEVKIAADPVPESAVFFSYVDGPRNHLTLRDENE